MNTIFKSYILILLLMLICSIPIYAEDFNPRIALLKSAILPGWGEISLGDKTGYIFMATEFIFWSSKIYFNEEEKLKEKEAYNYALKYAHIDPHNNYNETYYYNISRFISSGFEPGGYNAYVVQQAENIEDPILKQEYIQNNIYSDEYYWNWDNKDKMHEYGIKRKDASHFVDYAKTIGGAIIANHVFSAINSLRVSSKLKKMNLSIYFDRNMNPNLICSYKF